MKYTWSLHIRAIPYYLMQHKCVAWSTCMEDAKCFNTEAEADAFRLTVSNTSDWELLSCN